MSNHNIGDMVYCRKYGLGQITRKREVHKLRTNYAIYWFETDKETEFHLAETVSYYKKYYKALERRNAKATS